MTYNEQINYLERALSLLERIAVSLEKNDPKTHVELLNTPICQESPLPPEIEAFEIFPKEETDWRTTLHYSRKHRKNGRSGIARSDFRTAMLRQGVDLSMNDLKELMKDLKIDHWSEGREVRFSERYIPALISAIKERF
jgi:hypothetical protein